MSDLYIMKQFKTFMFPLHKQPKDTFVIVLYVYYTQKVIHGNTNLHYKFK